MKFYVCVTAAVFGLVSTVKAQEGTLRIEGEVFSRTGALAGEAPFEVGDPFVYLVKFDNSFDGPMAGVQEIDFTTISEFSAAIGSYRISGGSGNVGLSNDFVVPPPIVETIDQLSFQHFFEPFYDEVFGMPGRTDFEFTDGPISGEELNSLVFNVRTPGIEIVNAGESIVEIVENVEANFEALKNDPNLPILATVAFDNEALGSQPVGLLITITDVIANADINAEPLEYGTVAGAIVRSRPGGAVLSSFTNRLESTRGADSFVQAFSTSDGSAVASAAIDATGGEVNPDDIPGLKVGVYAGSGDTAARGIAFRTYTYSGEFQQVIRTNATLDVEFRAPRFGGGGARRTAKGGIYIYDAKTFAASIESLGGDIEEIFMPLSRLENDNEISSAGAIADATPSELLNINALGADTFSRRGAGGTELELSVRATALIQPEQAFTVLFDLSGISPGLGDLLALNSLDADETFFTDEFGLPIDGIVEIGEAEPGATSVDIDIIPYSKRNRFLLEFRRWIPVAILSNENFDAVNDLDRSTIRFGTTGEETAPRRCRAKVVNHEDNLRDLVCWFRVKKAGFGEESAIGVLTANTFEGRQIIATDEVNPISLRQFYKFKH